MHVSPYHKASISKAWECERESKRAPPPPIIVSCILFFMCESNRDSWWSSSDICGDWPLYKSFCTPLSTCICRHDYSHVVTWIQFIYYRFVIGARQQWPLSPSHRSPPLPLNINTCPINWRQKHAVTIQTEHLGELVLSGSWTIRSKWMNLESWMNRVNVLNGITSSVCWCMFFS